jgi:hypothetical protein
MEKEISEKSTKAEILKAYDMLLKNVKETKAESPKAEQAERQKKEIVEKVVIISTAGISENITAIKTGLNNAFDELLQNLTNEYKKLEEIRAAIVVEKQTLEDLYSLSANTDSLAAMLLVQKKKRENFEQEVVEWETEKLRQKAEEKEFQENLVKNRKREEEEFQYSLKIRRQKETDAYEAKKEQLEKDLKEKNLSFEKDISEREQILKNTENELAELQKANADFPEKLNQSLKEKEIEISEKLKTRYEFDIQIIKNNNESDLRLKEQTISSLQEKIKEQQTQLKEYSDKVTRAEAGMKDIAVKALESATRKVVTGE